MLLHVVLSSSGRAEPSCAGIAFSECARCEGPHRSEKFLEAPGHSAGRSAGTIWRSADEARAAEAQVSCSEHMQGFAVGSAYAPARMQ
jgi:hypothetical protein